VSRIAAIAIENVLPMSDDYKCAIANTDRSVRVLVSRPLPSLALAAHATKLSGQRMS